LVPTPSCRAHVGGKTGRLTWRWLPCHVEGSLDYPARGFFSPRPRSVLPYRDVLSFLPKAGEATCRQVCRTIGRWSRPGCRSDHASHGLDHRGVIRAAVGDFALPTSTDHSLSGARDRPVWQNAMGHAPRRHHPSRYRSRRPIMKKLGMLGIIGGAALLTVASPLFAAMVAR
jgi:hypothetical protein